MLFNTLVYPFFLSLSVAAYWLVPKKFRLHALIAASLAFYAFTSLAYLILIIILATFVFYAGKKIQQAEDAKYRKRVFKLSIAGVLFVLVWFKYSGLIFGSLSGLFGYQAGEWALLLPLGISFFTFEFIHYLIEIYYRHIGEHTAEEFFSFAFFFPTLASGPIKRFQTFTESLRERLVFSKPFFISGIIYIIGGYLQKYLVADSLVSRTVYLATPSIAPTGGALLTGLFLYSVRLYFDFAGLSNIAIGSALLFGIKVPINFSYPFFKSDLAAFWRSWHMSLTSWIRDYIYMPLVFRYRNSKAAIIGGLIMTMALVGMWHGASWNFLVFGMYHGLGLAFLQVMRGFKRRKLLPAKLSFAMGMLFTFIYVSMGWGFFVTHSLSDSILLYSRIFGRVL